MTEFVFGVLAVSAVVCAVACILQKNPIASAMWLVGTMFALAGIYVLLNAQFIAAIQVLVYAGAIMVLFLFVIMLLNLGNATSDLRRWPAWVVGAAIVAAIAGPLIALRGYTPQRLVGEVTGGAAWRAPAEALPAGAAAVTATAERGVVGAIAEPLFRQYLLPFEITSVLLLAAAVGAVVLAKRRL